MTEKLSCPDRQVLESERGKAAIARVALLMTAVDDKADIHCCKPISRYRSFVHLNFLKSGMACRAS